MAIPRFRFRCSRNDSSVSFRKPATNRPPSFLTHQVHTPPSGNRAHPVATATMQGCKFLFFCTVGESSRRLSRRPEKGPGFPSPIRSPPPPRVVVLPSSSLVLVAKILLVLFPYRVTLAPGARSRLRIPLTHQVLRPAP